MAAEDGRWDVDDVARGLVAKLVHRHPHVFGDVEVSGSDEVLTNWERLKAEEGSTPRVRRGCGDPRHVARARPRGQGAATGRGLGRRVAGRGLGDGGAPRGDREPLRATDEEEAVIGAILFAAVGAARKLGVDAERRCGGRPEASPNATNASWRIARSKASIRGRSRRTRSASCSSAGDAVPLRVHARVKIASCQTPRSRERAPAGSRRRRSSIHDIEVVDERLEAAELPLAEAEPPVGDRDRDRLNRPMIPVWTGAVYAYTRRSPRACSRGACPRSGNSRGRGSAPRRRGRDGATAPSPTAKDVRSGGRARPRAIGLLDRAAGEVDPGGALAPCWSDASARSPVPQPTSRTVRCARPWRSRASTSRPVIGAPTPRLRARDALWTAHSSKQQAGSLVRSRHARAPSRRRQTMPRGSWRSTEQATPSSLRLARRSARNPW